MPRANNYPSYKSPRLISWGPSSSTLQAAELPSLSLAPAFHLPGLILLSHLGTSEVLQALSMGSLPITILQFPPVELAFLPTDKDSPEAGRNL